MSRRERLDRHCFHRLQWHPCARWCPLSICRTEDRSLDFPCKSWADFPGVSNMGKAGSCRPHFDRLTSRQSCKILSEAPGWLKRLWSHRCLFRPLWLSWRADANASGSGSSKGHCTFNFKFNGHTWLNSCPRSIFAVEFILNYVLLNDRSI